MRNSKSKIEILDYVTVLGQPQIMTPEQKAQLDDLYRQMREIVAKRNVTIIHARSIHRE